MMGTSRGMIYYESRHTNYGATTGSVQGYTFVLQIARRDTAKETGKRIKVNVENVLGEVETPQSLDTASTAQSYA